MAKVGMSNGYDPNLVKEFVGRRERLQEEQDALAADAKEIFKEAKEKGLPVKALRKLIAERKARAKDKSAFDDVQDQVEALKHALGDFANTGLSTAAVKAAEAAA